MCACACACARACVREKSGFKCTCAFVCVRARCVRVHARVRERECVQACVCACVRVVVCVRACVGVRAHKLLNTPSIHLVLHCTPHTADTRLNPKPKTPKP